MRSSRPFALLLNRGYRSARWSWIRTAYAPAIAQHGDYDPARQHEPPPGQELEALEARENARELLNALLPGLWEDTLALLEDTSTAPLGKTLAQDS
jgi:hypothetical protein